MEIRIIFLFVVLFAISYGAQDGNSDDDNSNDGNNEGGNGEDEEDSTELPKVNVRAVDDDIYDEVLEKLNIGNGMKLAHSYSKREKKIYNILKRGRLHAGERNDPYKKTKCLRILVTETGVIFNKTTLEFQDT